MLVLDEENGEGGRGIAPTPFVTHHEWLMS